MVLVGMIYWLLQSHLILLPNIQFTNSIVHHYYSLRGMIYQYKRHSSIRRFQFLAIVT